MPLKIVGAALGRTGTNSLKLALEQLGFGPCHHMFEVRDHPEQLPYWQAAARGELPDWDQVFAGYRSCVDWPSACYWREIAAQAIKKYFKPDVVIPMHYGTWPILSGEAEVKAELGGTAGIKFMEPGDSTDSWLRHDLTR